MNRSQSSHLTPELTKTSSGLRVLRVPILGSRSVTVLTLVKTGSRYENPEVRGISHFLEHMVFKGTAKFKDSRELSAAVEVVGAEFNAYTSKEYTGYYVKAPSKHLGLAVDVISDMLMTPKIRQVDVDRERNVIIEEIHMYEDTPMRRVGDVFEQTMYAGTDLGEDIIGIKDSVSRIQREDFLSHLKTWYGHKNLVVVVAGDSKQVLSDDTLKLVERAFGKPSDTSDRNETFADPTPAKLGDQHFRLDYKKTEQAHFVMGLRGLTHTDKRKPALSVLTTVFGGGMSSRLFTEIREKRGLCYYVRPEADSYHDIGMFGLSAGVDTTRVEEALKAGKEELFALASTGKRAITKEEVAHAKSQILGKLDLSTEDSSDLATMFGMRQLLKGELLSLEDIRARIKRVQLEDVVELAQELLADPDLYLAMIGPWKSEKDQDRFRSVLKI